MTIRQSNRIPSSLKSRNVNGLSPLHPSRRLANKLWLAMAILVALTTVLITLLVYDRVSKQVQKQIEAQAFSDADEYARQVRDFFTSLVGSLRGFATMQPVTGKNEGGIRESLDGFIADIGKDAIAYAYIGFPNGRVVGNTGFSPEILKDHAWWRDLAAGKKPATGPGVPVSRYGVYVGQPYLSGFEVRVTATFPVVSNRGLELAIGTEVKIGSLASVLDEARFSFKDNAVFFCDQNGRLIANPRKLVEVPLSSMRSQPAISMALRNPDMMRGTCVYQTKLGRMVGVFVRDGDLGWLTVVERDYRTVMKPLNDLTTGIVIVSILVILGFSGPLAWAMATSITRPLQGLLRAMRRVRTGDFSGRAEEKGHDEIAELAHDFNSMAESLEDTIESLHQKEKAAARARIDALQAQINPHFLFNSLEMIDGMLFEEKPERVREMVVAMAKLLRYTIDSEHEDSTVGAELQHADHYLRLQSNRFADALTYEIKLEERVAFKHALRLLVQPLVENAVKHGFRHRRQRMHIIVSAGLMHDSAINITVEDDGTGMSPARLEELRRKLEDDMMNTDGIGLLNVQRRIRLRFGAAYGMTIDSTEEIGTRVTLRLPAEFSEPGGEIN